jgi:predicted membrane GTPase involved in stress response
MIAKELYRLLKDVEKMEKQLLDVPREKHDAIKDKLRKKKAELNRMRAVLEGKKDRKLKNPLK